LLYFFYYFVEYLQEMSFESNIQQWIILDNQTKQLNEKLKEIRDKKSQITENITKYAETNELMNSSIKISDGRLKFANTKVAEPLTFKYIERTLGEIIKNEDQLKTIMTHIKQRREHKLVQEIKRFSNN
jgi:hypothetical protein